MQIANARHYSLLLSVCMRHCEALYKIRDWWSTQTSVQMPKRSHIHLQYTCGCSGVVDCSMSGTRFESHRRHLCLSQQPLWYTALAWAARSYTQHIVTYLHICNCEGDKAVMRPLAKLIWTLVIVIIIWERERLYSYIALLIQWCRDQPHFTIAGSGSWLQEPMVPAAQIVAVQLHALTHSQQAHHRSNQLHQAFQERDYGTLMLVSIPLAVFIIQTLRPWSAACLIYRKLDTRHCLPVVTRACMHGVFLSRLLLTIRDNLIAIACLTTAFLFWKLLTGFENDCCYLRNC